MEVPLPPSSAWLPVSLGHHCTPLHSLATNGAAIRYAAPNVPTLCTLCTLHAGRNTFMLNVVADADVSLKYIKVLQTEEMLLFYVYIKTRKIYN